MGLVLLACLMVRLASGQSSGTESAEEVLPRVLFLTHSAGYEHAVVKRATSEQLSHAEKSLLTAAKGSFDVTVTQDCDVLSAEGLSDFDAVVFFTSGELPVDLDDREALLSWIRGGGAFLGLHSASDTFYEFPTYREMVGGTFDGHPWHQELALEVTSNEHPATQHLEDSWALTDELYQFRTWRPEPLRILLELDTASVDASLGKRDDGRYAVAWWRDYGEGRVFYSALGHRTELWEDATFLQHVLGALTWTIDGPDLPAPVPEGATVLLGPSGEVSEGLWAHRDGKPIAWWVDDASAEEPRAAIEVVPGTGDLVSAASFGDGLYHVEFSTPLEPEDEGQARGNSGVYIQGRYEVQVLDSHEREGGLGTCGAIYGKHLADQVATRPPERWQSYDILFTAPRFDTNGAKTAAARMTAWHNGLLVHDDVEIDSATAGGVSEVEMPVGPLLLQEHGDAVRYRNIWVLPTDR